MGALGAAAQAAILPAAIPSPDWSGFDIPLPWGSLRIHAYALCILAGIVVGLWLTSRRWAKRGGPADAIWDIAIWMIPAGIIGGRLYHVFSSPDRYFGPNFDGTGDPSAIWRIWEGGLGIWGAVLLGALGAWIGCRRAGVRLTAFMDAAAPGLLLAQAIGRWGNYFNQELFGGPTDLPWGLEVDPENANFPAGYDPQTLFHPTFLYESLWNLAGVGILLALDARFRFRGGRLFWIYAAYYTLGRVWIEALRIDEAEMVTIAGMTARLNVWTSVLVFVLAVAVFAWLTANRRRETDAVMLPGREATEPGPSTEAEGQEPEGSEAAEGPRSAQKPVEARKLEEAEKPGEAESAGKSGAEPRGGRDAGHGAGASSAETPSDR